MTVEHHLILYHSVIDLSVLHLLAPLHTRTKRPHYHSLITVALTANIINSYTPRLLHKPPIMASNQPTDFFRTVIAAKEEVDMMSTPSSTMPSSPELASSASSASIASLESPISPPDQPVADSFVFAFDIDGVLVRGGRPIPEALEAMKVLNGENEYGIQMYVPPTR